jgi:carbon-monoxide dehydrogenase medium subunit
MSPAFVEPATIEEACQRLADDPWGVKAIAGGTAVVLMMRQGLLMPDSLLDIRRLPGMRGIVQTDDVLRIGATTTLAEVAGAPLVRSVVPSLAHACAVVGNPRIRNAATLGGNVAEADYASDPPATLASLGARVHITGPFGARTLRVLDVITGFYETSLQGGEIITHIEVPLPRLQRGAVYLKYRSRSSEDRACVGVAARVDFSGGVVHDLDVVVAAVASTLQQVPAALEPAIGAALSAGSIEKIATLYAEAIDPMEDARGSAWYRRKMIRVFVRRALEQARDQQRAPKGGHHA